MRVTACLLAGVVSLGIVAFAVGGEEDSKDRAPPNRERELATEYRDTLLIAEKQAQALYRQGALGFGPVLELQQARWQAELDLAKNRKERISIRMRALAVTQQYEKLAKTQFEAGLGTELDHLKAKARRLKAELELARERTK